jgi:hypothetical protein
MAWVLIFGNGKLFDKSTNHFDFAVAIIGRYPVHSKQIEGLKLIY